VLTRFRYFGYKRRFTLKFNSITTLSKKMKKILKHPQKFSRQCAILLAVASLALSTSSGFAQVLCNVTTTWTDGTGSWFTAANWSNGVPTSTIAAVINNGGTAQINSSLAQAHACSLTLGNDISNSGTVSLTSNSTLAVTDSVVVGNKGIGTLTIAGSSAVTSRSASIAVQTGQLWTSNGTVTVNAGSSWAVNGNLTVGAGTSTMAFGVTPSSAGTITVSGTASLRGTINVTMTGTFTPGTRYTLLTATGGVSGTFSNVIITRPPPPPCYTPKINYDANHVYLDLIVCTD
jgi:T5SS/PEP-CTERM-associated repeat protein